MKEDTITLKMERGTAEFLLNLLADALNIPPCRTEQSLLRPTGDRRFDAFGARALLVVSDVFEVAPENILSHERAEFMCDARKALTYLLKTHIGKQPSRRVGVAIGKQLSGVTIAFQRAKDFIETDAKFRARVEKCKELLQ